MSIDFIIIHGPPGIGKTTLSQALHKLFQSPYFEFGWIPEFRSLAPEVDISPRQEEQISFENLNLVVKNYNRHGFKNVIITDLDDIRLLEIPVVFQEFNYIILTLYCDDTEIIKQRILHRDNGNGYCDWKTSIKINEMIMIRKKLPNEYRILNEINHPETIGDEILGIIDRHVPISPNEIELSRNDFFSYIQN